MLSNIAEFPATMVTWKIERSFFNLEIDFSTLFFLQKTSRKHHIQFDKLFHDLKNKKKIISKLEINLKQKILPSSDLFF